MSNFWGAVHEKQALLYILGYWLNGEGAFCIKYLIYLFS